MSDDSTTSSSNLPPFLNEPIADVGATEEAEGGISGSGREEMQKARSRIQKQKRVEIIGDLLRNFDIMIYCELSALFYMDCSTFRFLLRALVQFFYLTPKPPLFPEPPKSRPYVGVILGTNTLCALLHFIYARPEAGESVRGYLHGGLMIDFVGQKGPVSKFWLLLLDLLTLTIQLLMLAAHIEHQRIKGLAHSGAGVTSSASQDGAATSNQNLDSEERGVLYSGHPNTTDIELRTFAVRRDEGQAQWGSEEAEYAERAAMLNEAQSLDIEDLEDHPLDSFHTGEMVAVELHLFETIRKQYQAFGNRGTDDSNSSSVSPSTALVRNIFQGRLNERVGNRGSE
ncbi:MAG: hypothetical protein M1835_005140 [Candelina submexicana]|nr:MAG: hypothetical protein M1835_005140 [Candelina submexicana]